MRRKLFLGLATLGMAIGLVALDSTNEAQAGRRCGGRSRCCNVGYRSGCGNGGRCGSNGGCGVSACGTSACGTSACGATACGTSACGNVSGGYTTGYGPAPVQGYGPAPINGQQAPPPPMDPNAASPDAGPRPAPPST